MTDCKTKRTVWLLTGIFRAMFSCSVERHHEQVCPCYTGAWQMLHHRTGLARHRIALARDANSHVSLCKANGFSPAYTVTSDYGRAQCCRAPAERHVQVTRQRATGTGRDFFIITLSIGEAQRGRINNITAVEWSSQVYDRLWQTSE